MRTVGSSRVAATLPESAKAHGCGTRWTAPSTRRARATTAPAFASSDGGPRPACQHLFPGRASRILAPVVRLLDHRMTMNSRGRRTARFVLAACALAASLLAGEIAWRMLVNAHYRAQLAAFDEALYVATDDGALYGPRPGAEVASTIPNPAGPPTHVTYRVNADGFRVHPVWPPPQNGAQRLLFVGDSFT